MVSPNSTAETALQATSMLDTVLALSRFLIEQQTSLFAHTHPSDPTIKHLYHLAMIEHVSALQFESNYAKNLHTICSTNIKLLERSKARLVADIPDTRRAIRDLNQGIAYNEKLKRKYSSVEEESSQSSQSSLEMPENLSLDHPSSDTRDTPQELEKEKALIAGKKDEIWACSNGIRLPKIFAPTLVTLFSKPEELTSCISSLFFNMSLCINVNGFMSVPFPQGRGLRQGDPLIHVYPDLDTLSDGPRSTSWSNVLVKDTYIFDHDNGTLRRKPLLSRSRHRNKLLKYFELLNSGIMTETDIFKQFKRPPARPPDDSQLIYFRRPDPHFHQILQSFLHDGTALVSLSTKWFRTLQLDPLEILPDHYLTGLLSCRSHLHRLIPSRFPDPCCPLCGDDETDEHFLWSCPDKQPIWSTLASRFLVDPNCLQFSHVSQLPPTELAILPNFHFDGFTFIACTVLAIWQIHWKYVFHAPEFWPDEAAARATLPLRRLDRENAYQQQMKEKRKKNNQ
ncbi:hypothetical protein G6F60_000939 [Rhizopus arrhizus]|nr:hypothetical protein G6F60_000939 [Rhizopus arrhizus]